MTLDVQVHRHYPSAQKLGEIRHHLLERLGVEAGATPHNTLLATSLCADDVLATKDLMHTICGPFNAGGLAGLPFGGITAMSAFLHHIPDGGVGLLIHGPHVGITRDGSFGKLRRAGQTHHTTCCGSLMAALARLRRGPVEPTGGLPDEDDLEQSILVQKLAAHRQRILDSELPEREVTEVAYEVGRDMIDRLVAATSSSLDGRRLVCVGAVVINTAPNEEDWVDLRRFRLV